MSIHKLLINYHKKFTKERIFTTILVISERKIIRYSFSEFGYQGLKYILDKNGIYYDKFHPGLICEV